MDTIQVRLTHGIIKKIDELVKDELYPNRSEVVRDAVRRFVSEKKIDWSKQVGIIPNTGDSVKEIRKIRKILSKQDIDIDEINKLGEE